MSLNKKNIYFFLLGIGVGMLITSLLNMVYPDVKYIQYTDEQIKQRAVELGMVSIKEVISENEKEKESVSNENTDNNSVESKENKLQQESEIVGFIIRKGDTSEDIVNSLYQQGIIEDKEELMEVIIQENAQRKFNYGKYNIKKGTDYESLIEILTNR